MHSGISAVCVAHVGRCYGVLCLGGHAIPFAFAIAERNSGVMPYCPIS